MRVGHDVDALRGEEASTARIDDNRPSLVVGPMGQRSDVDIQRKTFPCGVSIVNTETRDTVKGFREVLDRSESIDPVESAEQ